MIPYWLIVLIGLISVAALTIAIVAETKPIPNGSITFAQLDPDVQARVNGHTFQMINFASGDGIGSNSSGANPWDGNSFFMAFGSFIDIDPPLPFGHFQYFPRVASSMVPLPDNVTLDSLKVAAELYTTGHTGTGTVTFQVFQTKPTSGFAQDGTSFTPPNPAFEIVGDPVVVNFDFTGATALRSVNAGSLTATLIAGSSVGVYFFGSLSDNVPDDIFTFSARATLQYRVG